MSWPSVKVSSKVNPDKVTLPKFSTVIVYSIVSPKPNSPSPLSLIDAVLVVSIIGFGFTINSVGSSSVFPSVSSPSSLTSITWVPVGLLPVAKTWLINPPISIIDWSNTKVAV